MNFLSGGRLQRPPAQYLQPKLTTMDDTLTEAATFVVGCMPNVSLRSDVGSGVTSASILGVRSLVRYPQHRTLTDRDLAKDS